MLTEGAALYQQGSLSSIYTAITYGCAAAGVLLAGLFGNSVGLAPTVYAIFSALAYHG